MTTRSLEVVQEKEEEVNDVTMEDSGVATTSPRTATESESPGAAAAVVEESEAGEEEGVHGNGSTELEKAESSESVDAEKMETDGAAVSAGHETTETAPAAAAAPAATPPPPPLLKGTLSYNLTLRRHLIRGMWNYENAVPGVFPPPQRFELVRNLGTNEDVAKLPLDGEFHGSFSLAYYHTTSKGKRKERSRVISESGVQIHFTPLPSNQDDDDDDNDGESDKFTVEGQGTNQFGIFQIKGTAHRSPHDDIGDQPTYNIELRKTYVSSATPAAATNTVVSSKKTKKRKLPSAAVDAMVDDGPLPAPAKSFPSHVVCLQGYVERKESAAAIGPIGTGLNLTQEVEHRISGMWSSGLDLIQADPTNSKGLCNKFEYEHKCTGDTPFPLSAKYAGWFYLSNEDGSRTRVSERDVQLKFRPNSNGKGHWNVEGRGSNVFGKYTITGTLVHQTDMDKYLLTIFRHFLPRKKSGAIKAAAAAAPSRLPLQTTPVGVSLTSSTGGGPPPLVNTSHATASAPSTGVAATSHAGIPLILSLDDVVVEDSKELPAPIVSPEHGTYSAVSRGVLRINDDGAHTCSGKWAMTREHYNNNQTSNFHFGLEHHHALEAAAKMKDENESSPSGKTSAKKDGTTTGDSATLSNSPSNDSPAAAPPAGPTNVLLGGADASNMTFPVDSAQYKGSFKMKKGGSKFQSIIDRQIVLKFRKNSTGSYNVHGEGVNSIGKFNLIGTLILSGRGSGHVELYRMYPMVGATTTSTQVAQPHAPGHKSLPLSQGKKILPSSIPTPHAASEAAAAAADEDDDDDFDMVDAMSGGGGATGKHVHGGLLRRQSSSRQTKLPSRLEDDETADRLRLMDKCMQILKFLRDKDIAAGSFFQEPVDPVAHGIPTYHQIITNPMDLGTIQTKMINSEIHSPDQFAGLVRLVFGNAMKFNAEPLHVVHQSGRSLLTLFEHKYREIERLAENMKRGQKKPTKAELKQQSRDAKRMEKDAKQRAKDDRKRKLDGDTVMTKKARIENEVQAMTGANERALAAVRSAAMSDPSSVSRVEFNLMLQLIQQVSEQVTHVHKLVASITPDGPATTAAEAGSPFTEAALPLPLPSYETFGTDTDVATTTSKRSGGSKKQKKGGSRKKDATEDVDMDMYSLPPEAPPVFAPPVVEEEQPLTLKEQEVLTETINRISPDKLSGVIQIIRESTTLSGNEEEIDLEIDQLDTATQRKLQRFVMKNVKQPRKKKAKTSKKKSQAAAQKEAQNKDSSGRSRNNGASTASSKPTNSFQNFGSKGDSDSDSDGEADDGGKSSDVNETAASHQQPDGFNLGDDHGFGDGSMPEDEEELGSGGMAANWNLPKTSTLSPMAKNDADVGGDAKDDLWGAAREEAAKSKVQDAERKAREEKMRQEAELAKVQNLAEAKARGDKIRAEQEEKEAQDAKLKEQQEKEAEEARKAAREALREEALTGVGQTVDLEHQRDLMKQYEQSYFDKELGGGASPSSDFGF